MAVRLEVTLTGLRVQFSGADRIAAFSRGLFVPYTRILGARVMTRADALASSPRLPCPGLWCPQRYRAGCWGVGERRQLWSTRRGTHVVVIYLAGRPFHRLVVDVDQPEQAHQRIDAALLHSKKTTARRSLRSHRRSTTDHSGPEPASAEQPRHRHRVLNRDLDRLPTYPAPSRRPDPSEQPHAPNRASASAPAPNLEGPREAGTRSRGSGLPPRWPRPTPSSSAAVSGELHDLAAVNRSRSSEIDPSVAATAPLRVPRR
jgi:hypothetical protein